MSEIMQVTSTRLSVRYQLVSRGNADWPGSTGATLGRHQRTQALEDYVEYQEEE